MPDRETFLRELDARLPFDEPERHEILDELRGHLEDSIAALRAGGVEDAAAEREALNRLGPVDRLGRELTSARRSSRRLLAAAGAGTWALASGALFGWLVGVLIGLLFAVLVAIVLSVASRVGGLEWSFGTGNEINTVITSIGLAAMVYVASRRVPATIAARAGYRSSRVRPVVAGVGGIILLAYALVGWSGPLSWIGVAAVLSLPGWWVLGATRPIPLRLTAHWRLAVLGGLAIVVLAVGAFAAVGTGANLTVGPSASPAPASEYTSGALDRIGLPSPELQSLGSSSGSGGATGDGRTWVAAIFNDPAALNGWRDIRVEAWRGLDAPRLTPPVALDPTATAPFVVAKAELGAAPTSPDGAFTFPVPDPTNPNQEWWPAPNVMVSGAVHIDRAPGLRWAWVALTGIAPDGQRRVITSPQAHRTAFRGTVLDWFRAAIDGS